MNDAQRQALQRLCERYNVTFDPNHYITYPLDSFMMAGWVEGWVGGPQHNGWPDAHRTLYVGCDPDGRCHS